jgi:hypothetical protein
MKSPISKTEEAVYFIAALFFGYIFHCFEKKDLLLDGLSNFSFLMVAIMIFTAIILLPKKLKGQEMNKNIYMALIISFGWCLGASWNFK